MNTKKASSAQARRGSADSSRSMTEGAVQATLAPNLNAPPASPAAAFVAYTIDVLQRSALFSQTLVSLGDELLRDEHAGLPLRLNFPSEEILDASKFDEPAGYSLLRILPEDDDSMGLHKKHYDRPVIVFDPRAGHGPGIGGFKRDSEVGMALHHGHPVYFVAHHMRPCVGQTLAHVHHALHRFVDEVAKRHPGQRPALYGNCQAGWAVALLAADCAGVIGPTILNGAPLSYWGGETGVNPMRLAGGLTGGVWIARLLGDLNGGLFDGAWLVQNFESLNPGHALFGKYRALFAHPETEQERFIEFERWWGEFCFLTREEIVAIVENLFIGNRLEEGGYRICDCCYADLRRLKTPMLVFASHGDNITPPQQALGWVPATWPTTEALVAEGQRIVYLINPSVGHLGIFVSADVAKREHRAILENLDSLEDLPPGLFEMLIDESKGINGHSEPRLKVRFEARRVEDLQHTGKQIAYERVRDVSQRVDALYQWTLAPWARAAGTPALAATLKWLHPMRVSRMGWAHTFNPLAHAIDLAAGWAHAHRTPVADDNPWAAAESRLTNVWSGYFDDWRRIRDDYAERLFAELYGCEQGSAGNGA